MDVSIAAAADEAAVGDAAAGDAELVDAVGVDAGELDVSSCAHPVAAIAKTANTATKRLILSNFRYYMAWISVPPALLRLP
ncbi:hypothetical protein AB0875_24455 [Micromonospora gifhornensis]|uniref:hypothetical protein n=1 Tax=Micromonospora TaxID=1873 RepID=UPI0013152168|nr:hypothetical protein [Verrucosispora sp. FIM060022]